MYSFVCAGKEKEGKLRKLVIQKCPEDRKRNVIAKKTVSFFFFPSHSLHHYYDLKGQKLNEPGSFIGDVFEHN